MNLWIFFFSLLSRLFFRVVVGSSNTGEKIAQSSHVCALPLPHAVRILHYGHTSVLTDTPLSPAGHGLLGGSFTASVARFMVFFFFFFSFHGF